MSPRGHLRRFIAIQGHNGSLSAKKTKNAKPPLIESFPMQFEGMKNLIFTVQRRLGICIYFLYSPLALKSVSVHLSVRSELVTLDFVNFISSFLREHSPFTFSMFIDNHIGCPKDRSIRLSKASWEDS